MSEIPDGLQRAAEFLHKERAAGFEPRLMLAPARKPCYGCRRDALFRAVRSRRPMRSFDLCEGCFRACELPRDKDSQG